MEGAERSTVLLVEADPATRERMGGWLEEDGFEVLQCPGPSSDEGCVGLRADGACTLTEGADVVVLNRGMAQESELTMHYLTSGKPVVSVGRKGEPVRVLGREWMVHLPSPDRTELIEGVRALVSPTPAPG